MKTALFTLLALLAFAGNSVLCRLALGQGLMDAAGFTTIRLLAGAITLVGLCVFNSKTPLRNLFAPNKKSWLGSWWLFIYAIGFSYAYVMLETGSGALILFGAVQLTLLIAAAVKGHRPVYMEWFGMILAFAGLVYLLIPAWGSPSLLGFMLMAASGMAWGLYTLQGQGSKEPLVDTGKNFLYALPWLVLLCVWSFQPHLWTEKGVALAVASGTLTSGLGYAIWYAVLPKLKTTQAGVVQLTVPIIATLGGVVFAGEALHNRLLIASLLVLGGIYLVMWISQKKHTQ